MWAKIIQKLKDKIARRDYERLAVELMSARARLEWESEMKGHWRDKYFDVRTERPEIIAPPHVLGTVEPGAIIDLVRDVWPDLRHITPMHESYQLISFADFERKIEQFRQLDLRPVNGRDCEKFAAALVGYFCMDDDWVRAPIGHCIGSYKNGHVWALIVGVETAIDTVPQIRFIEAINDAVNKPGDIIPVYDIRGVLMTRVSVR